MIPEIILQHLSALRRRERLLQLVWGVTRWVALVVPLILAACLVDYAIDRFQETPVFLRRTLFGVVVGAEVLGLVYFLFRPLLKKLKNDELALWVEDRAPELHQRLISAVQLNRPGADIEGMSRELIAEVTREAENQARAMNFARVADHRRLKWSAGLLVLAVVVAVLPAVLVPDYFNILLARHFLADREIPRRVTIENLTREVWPLGEKVQLQVRVRGSEEGDFAEVALATPGQPVDRLPLELLDKDAQTGDAVYALELPPATTDFTFRVYMGDGRLREDGQIHYVPRPIVVEQTAWILLPTFCGTKPNGMPYESLQPRGEVVGIPGSSARIQVKIQKPVEKVALELVGPDGPLSSEATVQRPEKLRRTIKPLTILHPVWRVDQKILPGALAGSVAAHMATGSRGLFPAVLDIASARPPLPADGTWAQGTFDLRPDETAYRIVVEDQYGFGNQPIPRRAIRIIPEDPPTVTLLREQFPPLASLLNIPEEDDFELEGLPIPRGGPIRIAYACSGPYGLGAARLKYRVLKKRESGNDDIPEDPWLELELKEVLAGSRTGPFDPRRGAFEFSTEKDNIWFHAVPSFDPYRVLGRTLGGGRFVFQTKTMLPDGKGGFIGPREGDQIEYFIEVFADRDPRADRPFARSETRIKTVVSPTELVNWLRDTVNEERRVRQLNTRQEDVFPKQK